ncbi:MAG: PadR family transcriptional regulator [Clostridia bacterium]|nr:PadR family transcriptional regulator [Clostridia bacterium]
MPREALQTLTEPMYYVLLSLTNPMCGIEIMDSVRAISAGRVVVGPGTLYTMLAKFEENGLICPVNIAAAAPRGTRRKTYVISQKGVLFLRQEYDRLSRQVTDGKRIMEKLK